MASAFSKRTLEVSAKDARIVPRMVWGLVNFHTACKRLDSGAAALLLLALLALALVLVDKSWAVLSVVEEERCSPLLEDPWAGPFSRPRGPRAGARGLRAWDLEGGLAFAAPDARVHAIDLSISTKETGLFCVIRPLASAAAL